MQGKIFILLSDMVIDKYGMQTWNEILEKVAPASEGSYTAGAQYEDAELMQLVSVIAELTGIKPTQLTRKFGQYIFPHLLKSSPVKIENGDSLKAFLLKVDGVIHKEVKRIHPDVYLPKFEYEDPQDDQLVMLYQSKRKMCALCEGMLEAASEYFQESVEIKHDICMHQGSDHCRFELTFNQAV